MAADGAPASHLFWNVRRTGFDDHDVNAERRNRLDNGFNQAFDPASGDASSGTVGKLLRAAADGIRADVGRGSCLMQKC